MDWVNFVHYLFSQLVRPSLRYILLFAFFRCLSSQSINSMIGFFYLFRLPFSVWVGVFCSFFRRSSRILQQFYCDVRDAPRAYIELQPPFLSLYCLQVYLEDKFINNRKLRDHFVWNTWVRWAHHRHEWIINAEIKHEKLV